MIHESIWYDHIQPILAAYWQLHPFWHVLVEQDMFMDQCLRKVLEVTDGRPPALAPDLMRGAEHMVFWDPLPTENSTVVKLNPICFVPQCLVKWTLTATANSMWRPNNFEVVQTVNEGSFCLMRQVWSALRLSRVDLVPGWGCNHYNQF